MVMFLKGKEINMISFVWSSLHPFYAGAGGSENYTAGQIRELKRRGYDCRILTLGFGENDGRDDFPDIEFQALKNKEELSELDDTIVFVLYPLNVKTKHLSYTILHCPPPSYTRDDPIFEKAGGFGKKLIATSKFSARMWSDYYGQLTNRTAVVYPFAEDDFARVERPRRADNETSRILFAGRLTPDKGMYTLLASLHMDGLEALDYELTVTAAGAHGDDGKLLLPMLKAHPAVKLVSARKTPADMAALMAEHDVVVMPSTDIFWRETFGIVSVEAQHAGCRVVASKSGGLAETDCGGLILVKPDNPLSLAQGIAKAAALGPLSSLERIRASRKFTVVQSVDALLKVMGLNERQPRTGLLHGGEVRRPSLYPQLGLFGDRLRQSVAPISLRNETPGGRLKS
jgi:D-inositol-3-phosphate glycosyltransferase